jgi:hypothetical protein
MRKKGKTRQEVSNEFTQAVLWKASHHHHFAPVLKLLNKGRHWVLVVSRLVPHTLELFLLSLGITGLTSR